MAPLDALAVDVLTKCLEFVPFDEVHTTVKELSRGLRSAARRALTRGRWRPLKLFCARGRDELFGDFELITGTRFDDPTDGSTYARPVVSDQTRSLFREVWALEPSEVLFEIWGWPVVAAGERHGTHVECLEGAIRFLDVVEPSFDGFGRIVGAISDRARWAIPQTRSLHDSDYAYEEDWANCLLVQWTCKILELRGYPDEMQLFLELQPDLGLFTWSEPKEIARWIVDHIWQHVPNVAGLVRDGWRNRREAEVLVAVAEEARSLSASPPASFFSDSGSEGEDGA